MHVASFVIAVMPYVSSKIAIERSRPEAWGRKDRADLTVLIRQQAEKLAQQYGLEVEELMAEATRLSRGRDV